MFANAYWDITNYGGFTPYVGGGAGAAFHRLSNIPRRSILRTATPPPLPGTSPPASAMTSRPQLKIDISYRYTDLGSAISGGCGAARGGQADRNEVRIGFRYYFW